MNKFIHLVILYKNHFSTASWYEAKRAEDKYIVAYKSQWLSNLHYVHFAVKAGRHKEATFNKQSYKYAQTKLIFKKKSSYLHP